MRQMNASGLRTRPMLWLAFLTATACSVHIFESLIMRLLPLPFIRLGLSNIIVMYLILQGKTLPAIAVNISKSLVGGLMTFTLLSPSTLLSLGGGLAAILVMWLACRLRLGFSPFGISIAGAVAHNLAQLVLVKTIVLPGADVFVLTPILLVLALLSGMLTAGIYLAARAKFENLGTTSDEDQR